MALRISPLFDGHAISEIVVSFYLDAAITDVPYFSNKLDPGPDFKKSENVLVLQPADTAYFPFNPEDLEEKRVEFAEKLTEQLISYVKRYGVSTTYNSNVGSSIKLECRNVYQNEKVQTGLIEIHYSQAKYRFDFFKKELGSFLKTIAPKVTQNVDAISITYKDEMTLSYENELDLKEVLNYGSRKLPEQFFSRFVEEIDFKGGGFLNRDGSKVERYSIQMARTEPNQSSLTILHLMGFDDKEDVPFEGTVNKLLNEIINEARYSNRAFLNDILTIKSTEAINLPKL